MTPAEACKLEVDMPVHVACTCGEVRCVAPAPAGCKGTVYDFGENAMPGHIYVDLLGEKHLHHDADCSCVFQFKIEDVTLKVRRR